MKEFKNFLKTIGINSNNVDYSEAGMQGDDFVSCDCGQTFIKEFAEKSDAKEDI